MANFSDPYVELSDKDTFEMVLASKSGQWDTVWTILGKKPYLVNSIPKERAWAVLHQAVWWKNVTAVDKILKIPGCDSELLTKNGLRPLDIETTGEIKKLLQDHIKSNKLHKGSFFLTPEDLVAPPDGIDPSRLTNEELALAEMLKVDELTAASEKRVWKEFFSILFFWKHLINSINPKTGLAPIHEAALAGDEKVITELMNDDSCDPLVRTEVAAIVGSGKTAAEIATNVNVKEAILYKLKDRKDKHLGVPTCVDIQEAHFNLLWYVQGAIEKNKICDRKYKPNYLDSFLEMEEEVYKFMNEGNNWEAVRDALANEFKLNSAKFPIQKANYKESFFECLIEIYTGSFYSGLNKCLREHPCTLPDVDTEDTAYRLFTALSNAVLLYGNLRGISEPFRETTYRVAKLEDTDIQKYKKKGFKFAWLSFTSSSLKELSNFGGSCLFIFDNTTECPWNPRGIEGISQYSSELEYLYPCGAQFEVISFVVIHNKTRIHLKLINEPLLQQPIQLIYEQKIQKFDTLVNTYKEIMQHKQPVSFESERLHNLLQRIESLRNFQQENYAEDQRGNYAEDQRENYAEDQRGNYAENQRENYAEDQRGNYAENQRGNYAEDQRGNYAENQRGNYAEDQRGNYAENQRGNYAEDQRGNYAEDRRGNYAEDRVKKIKLPRGEMAYHCRDCNRTCDYPCPEEHMYIGRCEFCIPRAEAACSRCRCPFWRHHRVDYRIEVEFLMNTVIDEDMMRRHTLVNEFRNQNMKYEKAKAEFNKNVEKLPTIPKLVEEMQNLIQDLTDIVTIEKNQQLDNYRDMLGKLNQCRLFVAECHHEMSEWNASSHHNIS